jgi:hypothetical protein
VPEPLWVARLIISQATRAKLSSRHNLDADEVLDAIVCIEGLYYRWDDDPERGRRALVEVNIRGVTVIVVLYPVEDPVGDVYALGSAYPRRRT